MSRNADAPNAEDLLTTTRWVRDLARGLVAGSAADDVAQQAWLAAVESEPDTSRSLRPWLARVVRFQAATWRRRERRARRRDEAVARAAEDPTSHEADPARIVARAELHRLLVEEVLALESPYRETVLWRYFEGRSAAEVARLVGVPAGTVRWRLKEGIDRLRKKLDERHGGDGTTWLAALVPFTLEAVTPTAAAAAGAAAQGGVASATAASGGITIAKGAVLMASGKSGILAGVVAVLGLGLGAAWWAMRSNDAPEVTPPATTATTAVDSAPEEAGASTPAAEPTSDPPAIEADPLDTSGASDTEPPAAPALADVSPPPGRIEGHVVTMKGEPVAAARLELFDASVPVADLESDSAPSKFRPVKADETEGAFRMDEVAPGSYRLAAEHPSGTRRVASEVLEVRSGETASVEIIMPSGIVLYGRVFDDDDSPRDGAMVTARGDGGVYFSTTTESDGTYEMDGLAPGRFQLTSLYLPETGREPNPISRTIVIPEAVDRYEANLGDEEKGRLTLSARVTRGGEPVTDYLVQMRYLVVDRAGKLVLKNSVTDDDGRFRLVGLFPGGISILIAEKPQRGRPGGRPEIFQILLPDVDVHSVELKYPENTVTGRLASMNGEGRSGRVALVPYERAGKPFDPMLSTRSYRATADADGAFAFERVAPGEYMLTALVDATEDAPSSAIVPPPIEIREGDTDLGTFTAEPNPCRVRVRVRDGDDRPVAKAFVAVRRDRSVLSGLSSLTNEDGETELSAGLSPGAYDFEVEARGYAATRVADESIDGDEHTVKVVVVRGGTLRIDARAGGRPVESAAVSVLDESGRPFPDARGSRFLRAANTGEDRTDVEGICRYDAVAPGRYRVVVNSPEYGTESAEVEVRDGEESTVRVTFRR